MPYSAMQFVADDSAPAGLNMYGRSHWMREFPAPAIEAAVDAMTRATSPFASVICARMGGAIADVPTTRPRSRTATPTASSGPSTTPPTPTAEPHFDWVRRTHDAQTPWSTGGVYVNALDRGEEDRVRAAYPPATWERLVATKNRWDPENVFRLNQNVPPRGAETRPGRVGRGLRTARHVELAQDPAHVMLGGLRRDHQALGDLRVRQALAEQREDLELARGELLVQPRPAAAGGAELAQQRRGGVGVGAGAEPFEGLQRAPGVVDRRLRLPLRCDHARDAEARAPALQGHPQTVEQLERAVEVGDGGAVAAHDADIRRGHLRRGDQVGATRARAPSRPAP